MDESGTRRGISHHRPGSKQKKIIFIRAPCKPHPRPLTMEAQNAGNCLWDILVPILYGIQATRGPTGYDSRQQRKERGASVPRRLPLSFPKCFLK